MPVVLINNASVFDNSYLTDILLVTRTLFYIAVQLRKFFYIIILSLR